MTTTRHPEDSVDRAPEWVSRTIDELDDVDPPGTIGAASRYQAEQISKEDVKLQDAELQAFMQTDTFHKLMADKAARRALANKEFQRAVGEPSVRAALASSAVQQALSSQAVVQA